MPLHQPPRASPLATGQSRLGGRANTATNDPDRDLRARDAISLAAERSAVSATSTVTRGVLLEQPGAPTTRWPRTPPPNATDHLRRRDLLGGLIHEYETA